jgi:hypothetical protein
MVLPDRIELSTSPLPMECSTTELRQHAKHLGNRPKWPPTRRPVLATRAPLAQARGQTGKGPKSSKTGADDRGAGNSAALCLAPVPDRVLSRRIARCAGRSIAVWMIEPCHLSATASPDVVSIKACSTVPAMKDNQDKLTEKTAPDVKDSRRDRLKLALRENLKRRKSQARGRTETSASSESAEASLDTASREET